MDADVERVWWTPGRAFSALLALVVVSRARLLSPDPDAGFTAWNVLAYLAPAIVAVLIYRFTPIAVVLHRDSSLTIRRLGRGQRLRADDITRAYVTKGGFAIVHAGRRRLSLHIGREGAELVVRRLDSAGVLDAA